MDLSKEAQIIFNPKRFSIITILYIKQKTTMSQLQKTTQLTWGDLDSHLRYLQKHNLITIQKKLTPEGPRTIITLTQKGKQAYEELTQYLQKTINKTRTKPPTRK